MLLRAGEKPSALPAAVAKYLRHGIAGRGRGALCFDFAGGFLPGYIIPNPQRVFVYVYMAPAYCRDGAVVCHSD